MSLGTCPGRPRPRAPGPSGARRSARRLRLLALRPRLHVALEQLLPRRDVLLVLVLAAAGPRVGEVALLDHVVVLGRVAAVDPTRQLVEALLAEGVLVGEGLGVLLPRRAQQLEELGGAQHLADRGLAARDQDRRREAVDRVLLLAGHRQVQ